MNSILKFLGTRSYNTVDMVFLAIAANYSDTNFGLSLIIILAGLGASYYVETKVDA